MARRRKKTPPMPLLLAETALSSWETIARRTAMMAAGTCSRREYRKMLAEKVMAAQKSGLALMNGGDWLSPWHQAAGRNAKRLRKRKP